MTAELYQKLKKTFETYGENELERVIAGIPTKEYHSLEGRYAIDKARLLVEKWKKDDLPKAGNKYRCIYVPDDSFIYTKGQEIECHHDGMLGAKDSWEDAKMFKQCFELVEETEKHKNNFIQNLPARDTYKHTGYASNTNEEMGKVSTTNEDFHKYWDALKSSPHKGLRFNSGKLRYDLVQPFAHEQMVKVLTRGAEKYAERNWEKGMAWSNVISSLKRHLAAIEKGEDYDIETGELHAAHLACNAHFLTAYYKIYPQGDDRPHNYLNRPKIGLDIDEVIADFVGKWCEHHKVTVPEFWNFDKDMAQKFQEVANDKEFWMSIKPKINPKDLPFEPHCYITSRPILNEWTEQWLQDNGFPAVPVYTIGYGESKVEVAKKSGIDIFVDDRYENFVELNRAGICTFLMDSAHNQRYSVGYRRIKNLKELV